MAKTRTPATNLFTTGLLTTAAATSSNDQEQSTDDPLFANARIREVAQRAAAVTDGTGFPQIEITLLDNNPFQPRRRMSQARLESLAREIKQYGFKGVLLARKHPEENGRYQLVYGHRRREAAKLAGLEMLPVLIDNTIVDDEMRFLAINENLLRDDLTPLDEAHIYAVLLALPGMTQQIVADRLGVSRGYLRNRTDILKAQQDVQDMVEEHPHTMKAVVYLKDIGDDEIRKAVIQALVNEEITINQIKSFIEQLRKAQTTEMTQDLVTESKQRTEAATSTTKLQTFTKFLSKYQGTLQQRGITGDEREALQLLIATATHILESYKE